MVQGLKSSVNLNTFNGRCGKRGTNERFFYHACWKSLATANITEGMKSLLIFSKRVIQVAQLIQTLRFISHGMMEAQNEEEGMGSCPEDGST